LRVWPHEGTRELRDIVGYRGILLCEQTERVEQLLVLAAAGTPGELATLELHIIPTSECTHLQPVEARRQVLQE